MTQVSDTVLPLESALVSLWLHTVFLWRRVLTVTPLRSWHHKELYTLSSRHTLTWRSWLLLPPPQHTHILRCWTGKFELETLKMKSKTCHIQMSWRQLQTQSREESEHMRYSAVPYSKVILFPPAVYQPAVLLCIEQGDRRRRIQVFRGRQVGLIAADRVFPGTRWPTVRLDWHIFCAAARSVSRQLTMW